MQTLTAGTPAPDFTLTDDQGNSLTLSSLRGRKVLLYFYPKAMTPGCTVQACGLRDSQAELSKRGVLAFGISPDKPASLAKFVARDNLNFRLLADPDHAVAEQFGVWGPKKFMGRDTIGIHRTSFLVDEQGLIAKVFDDFKTSNHHEVVLAWLDR